MGHALTDQKSKKKRFPKLHIKTYDEEGFRTTTAGTKDKTKMPFSLQTVTQN